MIAGEWTTVFVDVTNRSNRPETYFANLWLDRQISHSEEVLLGPGKTRTVWMPLSVSKAGTYEVRIGSQISQQPLVVEEPPPTPTPDSHTHSHAASDTHTDTHTYTYTYTGADSDAYSYACTHFHAGSHSDADTYARSNCHSGPHSYQAPDSNAYCGPDPGANTHQGVHCRPDSSSGTDPDAGTNGGPACQDANEDTPHRHAGADDNAHYRGAARPHHRASAHRVSGRRGRIARMADRANSDRGSPGASRKRDNREVQVAAVALPWDTCRAS